MITHLRPVDEAKSLLNRFIQPFAQMEDDARDPVS